MSKIRKFALSRKLCYPYGNNLLIVFQQKSGAFPLFSVVIPKQNKFFRLTAGKTVKFHQHYWWNFCFITPEIDNAGGNNEQSTIFN